MPLIKSRFAHFMTHIYLKMLRMCNCIVTSDHNTVTHVLMSPCDLQLLLRNEYNATEFNTAEDGMLCELSNVPLVNTDGHKMRKNDKHLCRGKYKHEFRMVVRSIGKLNK